jgi:hypothetical protein
MSASNQRKNVRNKVLVTGASGLLGFAAIEKFLAGRWWAPQGHRVVGSIGDHLLNYRAKAQVAQILGFELRIAGPWADCAKSVSKNDHRTFSYKEDPHHPEYEIPCTGFRTAAEQKADGRLRRAQLDAVQISGDRHREGLPQHLIISTMSPSSAIVSIGNSWARTITTWWQRFRRR